MTPKDDASALAGRRILIVEDEMLIAMQLEDMLLEMGCEVIGPATSVAEALKLIGAGRLDGALLDVNLGGEQVYPVADALAASGAPFVFVTGYGRTGLSGVHRGHPTLPKPINPFTFPQDITAALAQAARPRKAG